jgi:methyl-accepting chemotaxis protein
VEQGSRLVDDTGATVGAVVEQVARVTALIADLGRANAEQRNGIEQIGQAVGQLDHTTQQNAALVEESAAAAESLRRQAETLTASVARFRLAS